MSMTIHTILQIIGVFFAYSLIVIAIPAVVLKKRIEERSFSERIFCYFTVSNFCIISLVFILEFLHISNSLTLWLGMIILFLLGLKVVKGVKFKNGISWVLNQIRKLQGGQLGKKTAWYRIGRFIFDKLKMIIKTAWKTMCKKGFDVLFVLLLIATVVYMYGSLSIHNFGYAVSDLPVHNYWINGLDENKLFIAGVYPFGFHNIIYFLHRIFGFDTYVILRVFGITQAIYLHIFILLFLKKICKTRFIPYVCVFTFILFGGLGLQTYFRYSVSLPQEYGMLCILPGAYFAIGFLQERRLHTEKGKKNPWEKWYLALFGANVTSSLSIHFYDTIVLGLFCVGIGIGFVFLVLRWKYFYRLVLTGLIALLLAVAPMALAFAMGTPLQGSFGWGMNILSGKSTEEEFQSETQSETEVLQGTSSFSSEMGESMQTADPGSLITDQEAEIPKMSIAEKCKEKFSLGVDMLQTSVFQSECKAKTEWFLLAVGGLFFIGLVYFALRQYFYAGSLISVSCWIGILAVLNAAKPLGFPALMNAERASIYFAFALFIGLGLLLDSVLYLLFFPFHKKMEKSHLASRIMQYCSLILCVSIIMGVVLVQPKKPVTIAPLETNGAITCLQRIMNEEPEHSWTICSANDERIMMAQKGYHMELAYLIYNAEFSDGNMTIYQPTKKIFFFIEKRPLDYYGTYEGSGRMISREGAMVPLQSYTGSSVYWQESRYVLMCRAYYWAQVFQKEHPYDMTVYYEDDDFICYQLVQDNYRSMNLAIDYRDILELDSD